MNIIFLSGTSGKQLWPLTNDLRSSQFIKILKTANGSYESIFQRTCRQIQEVDPSAEITVAATKAQASVIRKGRFRLRSQRKERCRGYEILPVLHD